MNKATRLMSKALKSCRKLDYHMFEKQADILDDVDDRLENDEELLQRILTEHSQELTRDA